MSNQRWYQMLTHDLNGNFSKSATIGSASAIAAVGLYNYLTTKDEEQGKWQKLENDKKYNNSKKSISDKQR